jgi:hypothetical protein
VFHRGKSAADVNGDRRVEPVGVDLGNADPLRARPGIIDEAIDPTEPSHGMSDHRLHVRLDGHIGWHEAGALTQSPRKLFTPFAPTSGDYDSSSSSTNSAAVRAPMPLVPPVMIATFPSSDRMGSSSDGTAPQLVRAESFEPIEQPVDYVPGN